MFFGNITQFIYFFGNNIIDLKISINHQSVRSKNYQKNNTINKSLRYFNKLNNY